MADHQRSDVVAHEALIGLPPFGLGEAVEVGGFHPADDLQAAGVKVVIEAGELHGGPVHVRRGQHGVFISLGEMDGSQVVLGHDGLELDGILASHGRRPPMIIYMFIVLSFSPFGKSFPLTRAFIPLSKAWAFESQACTPLGAHIGRGSENEKKKK